MVDRRNLIVEAAAKSFSLFGYKGTTMDQVAKIANVGKGTIYTFFANKEELFQDIMNRLLLEMKRVAEQAVDPNRNFFDNLHEVLNRLADFRDGHELAIKLAHEVKEIGTPMAQEGLGQIEQAVVSYIRMQIESAVQKGELRPCDPEITAYVMLKLYMALTAEWPKTHEPFNQGQAAQLLRFYLEQGLAPD
jgi:AcrR family transcriptional regulator